VAVLNEKNATIKANDTLCWLVRMRYLAHFIEVASRGQSLLKNSNIKAAVDSLHKQVLA
jgi:hypothetical protein